MSKVTTVELKSFKRSLKIAHQRSKDILYKVAMDKLSDKKGLIYTELNIQNIDKIMYKVYKTTGNKLIQEIPTVFKNVLFSFILEKDPACFILHYNENGKTKQISVCSFHIFTDEEGQILVSIHYLDRETAKTKQRVKQVMYKMEGENIYSFGESNNFKSKIISFTYTLQLILNQYCEVTDLEKIETDEELSEGINKYFQNFIKDELKSIEKSKEDMDLTNAINLLNADDEDDQLLFASST